MGEVVFVEMPSVGSNFEEGQQIATIESVKIAAELNTPIAGTVSKINEQVVKETSLINEKPHESWLVEMLYQNEPAGLISKEEYNDLVASLAEN